MCTVTTYQIKPITYRRIRRYDPTRTTSLRNAFVRRMNGKFDRLGSLIKRSIVVQDVFGLKQKNMQLNLQANQLPGAQAFDFARSAEKLAAFNAWLEEQIKEGLLEVSVMQQSGVAIEDQWTNKYISDSYERGVQRARYEMKKSGMDIPGIDETGGIKASMSTPFHLDRVGLVGTRVYEDLRGITTQMSTQINRVLAQGLADGDNPLLLANKLVSTINGKGMGNLELTDTLGRFIPAKRRAQTLARTEIIRAHHQGTMQEYANWAVEGVIVQAEFMTAQDDRVCPSCEALEGVVMTLEDAKNVIPVHPNCRCIMLPVESKEKKEGMPEDPTVGFEDMPESDKAIARGFENPAHGQEYLKAKQEYDKYFQGFSPADLEMNDLGEFTNHRVRKMIADKLQGISSAGMRGLQVWQTGTWQIEPSILKYKASLLEKRTGPMLFKRNWSTKQKQDFLIAIKQQKVRGAAAGLAPLTDSGYIQMRAFNQAYMKAYKVPRYLKLHRGVGGRTGGRIREDLLREGMKRTQWNIPDAPLSGYTDVRLVAIEFGFEENGITFTDTISRNDIFWHPNLLSEMLGMAYHHEREFLVLSRKKMINIINILYASDSQ